MKRFTALLMSLCLLLGILSGCGSGASSTSSTAPVSESSAQETEKAAPSPSPAPVSSEESAQEPEASVQEETAIQEYVRPAAVLPLVEEPATLSAWLPFTDIAGLISDVSQHLFFTEMEKRTGVHLDIVQVSTWVATEQFNLMVASETYYDLISSAVGYYGSGQQAIEDDVLISLNPYMEDCAPNYTAIMNSDPSIYPQCVDDEGNIAAFYQFKDKYIESNGFAIRQDWLDALGLEIPKTIDETAQALEAIKGAYDCAAPIFVGSNGVASQTGLICAFGVPGYTDDDPDSHLFQIDGKVTSSLLTEEYKDYITMMADWYQRGLIDKDFTSMTSANINGAEPTMFASGNIGMLYCSPRQLDQYPSATGDGCDLEPMAHPVLNEGDVIHIGYDNSIVQTAKSMSVSTSCADPELAVRWMDTWYTEDIYALMNYGIEGESYVKNDDGTYSFTDAIVNAPEGWSQAVRMTAISDAFIGIYCTSSTKQMWSDLGIKAREVWGQEGTPSDGAYNLPTAMSLTADEMERFSLLSSDITTMISENIVRFIDGTRPLSEWDSFVDQLKEMGIEECCTIYQSALDRYNQRVAA